MEPAKPKCPECGVRGAEHIICDDTDVYSENGEPWIEVAFCDQCGHIYGVFAKIVHLP